MAITRWTWRGFVFALGIALAIGSFVAVSPLQASGSDQPYTNPTASATVTGTVSSSNGPITSGQVSFYNSCQGGSRATAIVGSRYRLPDDQNPYPLPPGEYRVFIQPDPGTPGLTSWHNAKLQKSGSVWACESADVVTLSEGTNTLDLVAAPGTAVSGAISTNGFSLTSRADANPTSSLSSFIPVVFYPSCRDQQDATYYAGPRVGSRYQATVPPGQYRVMIAEGLLSYWNNAKYSCEDADVVTVSGASQTLDLVFASRTQSIIKPKGKARVGETVALARRTNRNTAVSWRTTTKRVCSISKWTVNAKRKGTCKLVARASRTPSWPSYEGKFSIRIR